MYLPFHLGIGKSLTLKGFGSITIDCPYCKRKTNVPEGTYTLLGMAQSAIDEWHTTRRQQLIDAIEAAKQSSRPREDVERALQSEPSLWDHIKDLVMPSNTTEFWTFIAALLTILALVAPRTTTINNTTTIIDQTVVTQPATTQKLTTPDAQTKPPPPPKRTRSKTRHKKRR